MYQSQRCIKPCDCLQRPFLLLNHPAWVSLCFYDLWSWATVYFLNQHPQTNGLVSRLHSVLLLIFSCFSRPQALWLFHLTITRSKNTLHNSSLKSNCLITKLNNLRISWQIWFSRDWIKMYQGLNLSVASTRQYSGGGGLRWRRGCVLHNSVISIWSWIKIATWLSAHANEWDNFPAIFF